MANLLTVSSAQAIQAVTVGVQFLVRLTPSQRRCTSSKEIGTHFEYVPYRGAAPVMADLNCGQIDLTCLEASATFRNVQAGKFKAYAVMSEKRWPKSPNTPIMIESGVPGLSLSFWQGLWTTAGTPKEVVDRLVDSVQAALADPSVRQRLDGLGDGGIPA